MNSPLVVLCFALIFVGNHSMAFHRPLNLRSENANPVASHVLDTARGKPAAGLQITFFKVQNDEFIQVAQQMTDADGRVGNLISAEDFQPGVYKLRFDTKDYYASFDEKTFYPYIEIVFEIENHQEHYHVPILLSPYGYSNYRGS